MYLAAVGVGTDPDGLSLEAPQDGTACHFDLDQPLHSPVLSASRAARAGGHWPPPFRQDWHSDQLRLLGEQARQAE